MLVACSVDAFRKIADAGAPHAVTIGNFDGVHMGHRELVRVTQERAEAASWTLGRKVLSVLVTFDPHPVHVVRGMTRPDILTPLPRKLELLEKTGLDAVLVLPFTPEMAKTSAEDFVRTYLVDLLHVTDLVTGYNFALGKNREGNYSSLSAMGEKLGFKVTQIQPVIVDRETVSSTLIREHIRSGEMEKAAKLLGRMHSVDGGIIHGQARGRKLGFPTANIDYGHVLLPPLGAYATWLQVMGDETVPGMLQSMTSVGTNPTFGRGAITVEAHALDFSGDLYGKTVRLHFATRLRAEITFKNVDDLVARLRHDAACTREALARSRVALPM